MNFTRYLPCSCERGTSNLKRFGNFLTDLIPDPAPVDMGLPV
jgi:hypothetical protein